MMRIQTNGSSNYIPFCYSPYSIRSSPTCITYLWCRSCSGHSRCLCKEQDPRRTKEDTVVSLWKMDEGSFSIEAAILLKVICWLSPCSMIMRSDRVICLRLPLEISVTRSSILHRQESRGEYSMSGEKQNTALCKKCIKLCKSNFYRVVQLEFKNTFNGVAKKKEKPTSEVIFLHLGPFLSQHPADYN